MARGEAPFVAHRPRSDDGEVRTFIAESVVYDSTGTEEGRGSGIFVRSKLPLREALGYSA